MRPVPFGPEKDPNGHAETGPVRLCMATTYSSTRTEIRRPFSRTHEYDAAPSEVGIGAWPGRLAAWPWPSSPSVSRQPAPVQQGASTEVADEASR